MTKINSVTTISFIDTAGKTVDADYKGRKIKIITYQTLYSCKEQFKRVILGILAVIVSIGLALMASKVRGFFTKTIKSTRKEEFPIESEVPPEPRKVKSKLKSERTKPEIETPEEKVEEIITTKDEPPQFNLPPTPKEALKPEVIKPKIHFLPKPPEGVIKNGYGEYLVYRTELDGKKVAISEKEYESIFEVIEAARTLKGEAIPSDRHAYLEEKIQEKLGKEVKIAFIPRTLYEQIFLHACIQEELDHEYATNVFNIKIADALIRPEQEKKLTRIERKDCTPEKRKELINKVMTYAFWQLCMYDDQDFVDGFKKINEEDYRPAHLIKVAAKLNEMALDKFKGKDEGFTFEQLVKVQKDELAFFRSITDPTTENYRRVGKVNYGILLSLAHTFRDEQETRRSFQMEPLGVRNERDEQILKKAMQLECTAEAVNHLLLYRAARLGQDKLTKNAFSLFAKGVYPHSLSFGSSLYGGALYDRGSSAARYGRDSFNDVHVITVPLKEQLEGTTPFHAYFVHPLINLGSQGECYHPRTKFWALSPETEVLGFNYGGAGTTASVKNLPDCYKTTDTQGKVEKAFAEYQSKAYILAAAV